LVLGTSHDTSAFACDCLEDWWRRFGRGQYPRAAEWLLLCDGGGSNSARTYLFKQDLQAVANRLRRSSSSRNAAAASVRSVPCSRWTSS